MQKFDILKMTLSDLNSISENLQNSFEISWSYSIFKDELLNVFSKYIVAKKDEIILGFAGIWQVYEESHIMNIAVHNDFRKKGIGSTLLKELIEMAKTSKSEILTLEVKKSNIPAQKLYSKFGFETVGVRKNYYISGNKVENGVIMTLHLK